MQRLICLTAIVVCLISIAVGAMPEPYYSDVPARVEGADAIAAIISEINYSAMYIEDKFDCTEIAAHAEWRLENMGIETKLVMTEEPNPAHMFLLCNTSEGWVPIETCYDDGVAVPIRDPEDWHYDYTLSFEGLPDLHEQAQSDVHGNWWNTIEP